LGWKTSKAKNTLPTEDRGKKGERNNGGGGKPTTFENCGGLGGLLRRAKRERFPTTGRGGRKAGRVPVWGQETKGKGRVTSKGGKVRCKRSEKRMEVKLINQRNIMGGQ